MSVRNGNIYYLFNRKLKKISLSSFQPLYNPFFCLPSDPFLISYSGYNLDHSPLPHERTIEITLHDKSAERINNILTFMGSVHKVSKDFINDLGNYTGNEVVRVEDKWELTNLHHTKEVILQELKTELNSINLNLKKLYELNSKNLIIKECIELADNLKINFQKLELLENEINLTGNCGSSESIHNDIMS